MDDDIQRLARAWQRIDSWLTARAPATAALLRPGATDAQIAAVEDVIGVKFPPALRAWYKIHDGANEPAEGESWWAYGFLPGNQDWYRLDEVQSSYVMHTRDWGHEVGLIPITCIRGDIWHGLYIDGRPDEPTYGNLGHWHVEYGTEPLPADINGWPLSQWFTSVADTLEQGRSMFFPYGKPDQHYHPALAAGGGLTWIEDQDMDQIHEGVTLLEGPS